MVSTMKAVQILFSDGKLYDLEAVPNAPECFAFKVYDPVLKMNVHFMLYRSGDVWELMVMDDRICIEIAFDQYQFDKDTNCFYTVDSFGSKSKP